MKIFIRFYLDKTKVNKENKSPIKCRITFNKKRKEFSTGIFIEPNNWNKNSQFIKQDEPDAVQKFTQLSLIRTKVYKAFLLLQVQESAFTVQDIYKTYNGEKLEKQYNVIEFYDRYLKRLKTLIGIDIKQVTWSKFDYIKSDVKGFIKWEFKTDDIPLKELKANFLKDLEYYYKTEKGLKQITINKKIQRFRKVIKVAVAENYLEKDPFMLFKAKPIKNTIVFLSPDELKKLENYKFSQPRLCFVKDLFIFCCYTGLPYRELMDLKSKHIIDGFDGNKWIKINRRKTSKPLSIPLLPKALDLLNNYSRDDFIFPRISNQKYNSYLKEIGAITGIEKKFTTHMARRTFASTVLLYNNVPMEIVSELLGHSSLKITQDSYGKVVEKRISLEINKLK